MRAQLHDRLRGQMEINNSDKGVVLVSLSAQTPDWGRGVSGIHYQVSTTH